jgi:dTDP-4-dehydrorhamnose 3,5-epimerase
MRTEETPLSGLIVLHPQVSYDERGYFLETWSQGRYDAAGITAAFAQDNVSFSSRGVIRGLHAQAFPNAQAKLVTVLKGAIFDVAVDARKDSKTYGRWFGRELTAKEGAQLWIPEGFFHGFQSLSEETVVLYKCTKAYHQPSELRVRWNDPALGVEWPIDRPLLSAKDATAPTFKGPN